MHAAKDLYDSPLFRKARAYAETRADAWYILSAKYGLVEPNAQISPYDRTLDNMGIAERRPWGFAVFDQLRTQVGTGDTVVFLAGQRYREFIEKPLQECGVAVEVPMEGMRIGEQLSWLNPSCPYQKPYPKPRRVLSLWDCRLW
ncbi:MAG: hypothetical protein IIA14_07685 [SAR324 cluster bacterium]|nr:hypothetical protein [SAR324 cluster bacterium]